MASKFQTMRCLIFLLLFLASCSKDHPEEPVLGDWYASSGRRWIFTETGTICIQHSGFDFDCGHYWYRDENDIFLVVDQRKYDTRYITPYVIEATESGTISPETFTIHRK